VIINKKLLVSHLNWDHGRSTQIIITLKYKNCDCGCSP